MKARERESYAEWYNLIPLIFVVTILPLIVYLKVAPLTGASYNYWTGTTDNYDFFSYYKGIVLIMASLTALFLVVARFFQEDGNLIKRDLKPIYIATGVYMLSIIGSTFLSDYRSVALTGFPDRYEGLYVLVAYLVLFLTTTTLVSNEKHVKIILGSLLVGALAIGLIGFFQYIGYDLLKTDFAQGLFLPEQYMNIANALAFQFDKYTVYATLYHYNYVGSYTAMLFPLCFALSVLMKDKRFKAVMIFMTILIGVIWLGSNARSGLVGGGLALLIFLIAINRLIRKYWKYFTASFLVIIAIFIGLNQVSGGFVSARVGSLFTDVKVLVGLSENVDPASESIPLKDIIIDGTQGTVVTATETLSFTFKNDALTFTDSDNKTIESSYDINTGKLTLKNQVYRDYSLIYGDTGENLILKIVKGPISLIFDLNPERIALIDNKGNEISLGPVEAWGFEGNERLGSSRGYIWSRTLPLLKNTILFGYGPDTFAIAFPQHDIFGKMYAYHGDMWQLVDKPHNLYLQIAINTGVVSLLAFLFLVGFYIVKSFRLYVSNPFEDFLSQAGVGVFVAIIGYLGAAVFNDSVVSVAPVFWCLLGLGVSINHMLNKRTAKLKS
ncbi:MAG: O-antigen ligase family protein [Desulfitobacterium sp.]